MEEDAKTLIVQKIRNGTVVDHIETGKGLRILSALTGALDRTMVLAINVSSARMGRKDMIKIEDKYLEPKEQNYIALISPNATIVTIKDFNVVRKEKALLPEQVTGVVKCKNPACVSNREPDIEGEFRMTSKKISAERPDACGSRRLKCIYCEHEIDV